MVDVTIGVGSLAGRGVFAARDFSVGEVVLTYRLRPLTEADYRTLADGEDLFVHSFGGRRYLYPAPARFVNHSDHPSCGEDFDQGSYVALRRISQGEPITIDAGIETAYELETFAAAYQDAIAGHSAASLAALVDGDATLWQSGRATRGRDAVVAALLAAGPSLSAIELSGIESSGIEWFVGTGRWEALAAADISDGRHLTILLKIVRGNWQIIYQHVG